MPVTFPMLKTLPMPVTFPMSVTFPTPKTLPITPETCRYLFRKAVFRTPKPICRLRTAGFRGFLIGETFMKTPQPGDALKGFIQGIEETRSTEIFVSNE